MTSEEVGVLLKSSKPLVVVEAPAGCGKTYQGAKFACFEAANMNDGGRALVLTHTHAACSQFSKEAKANARRLEIRTIDSLVAHIATIYHKSLGLPPDPPTWARRQGDDGFSELARRVAQLLSQKKMICAALADRYPVIVADEHQDSSKEQHDIILSLHAAGARLRIFGDPMQLIYEKTKSRVKRSQDRWSALKSAGEFAKLDYPYRWQGGSMELGKWVLRARETLKHGGAIDLTKTLPSGLNILFADNIAASRSVYQPKDGQRKPIDNVLAKAKSMLVLTGQNENVEALRAFWGRTIPIWEGHVRGPLGTLALEVASHCGDERKIAGATVDFIQKICVGFSPTSHSKRFHAEIASACSKATVGKPALIQELARCILAEPNHAGVSKCLIRFRELVQAKTAGFSDIHIDYARELLDAIRLGDFCDVETGLTELHRRRAFLRPMPPDKAISTIHKAKGLECDNAMIIACDARQFSHTDYARSRLYVALSRAKRSLTLVISKDKPSPLFKIA
ncbi:ATP-dependent helicase [Steroidobacter agaridevorans]|uniref:ATP-dependent helicase n=1 Tax=Steroidobacter agaridevorans TaxID=2695856 RepID=UPI00137B125B|nr:ATP-dependent helicase [Steroidobacter agaridevorans]